MTPRPLLATLLALLLAAPLAAAHGPYTGTVRQGEADLFTDDHSGPICAMVITTWTVTLTYAPASDTLTLVVAGHGVSVGKNGVATVSFTTSNSCAFLEIAVHGTLVATSASYSVTVTTGMGGGVDA